MRRLVHWYREVRWAWCHPPRPIFTIPNGACLTTASLPVIVWLFVFLCWRYFLLTKDIHTCFVGQLEERKFEFCYFLFFFKLKNLSMYLVVYEFKKKQDSSTSNVPTTLWLSSFERNTTKKIL